MQVRRILLATFGAAALLSAQIPDFTPPTPLFGALLRGDVAEAKRLLASGADPNEGRFLGAPPLLLALMRKDTAIAQAMIAKGADVKALDGGGSSTLMWAATSEVDDSSMVEELLRRGVDPNLANKSGETALTWALRRGYTPIVESLKAHGASDKAVVKQSVDKAITLLQKSGPEFSKVSSCSSCHHQSLPQMAYSKARERGFTVDAAVSEQQIKSVIAMFRPARESMLEGKPNIPDPSISVSYSLLGLAAEGYKPDSTTEAMAHIVSLQQLADGSFTVLPARPPIESSAVSATALSLRALQLYGKDPEPQVVRARDWLRTVKPHTNEDRVMQVLGLVWSKASAEDLRRPVAGLISEQRSDGGWGQLPALESDAYATGQALVSLQAAGVSTSDPAYQRGVAFLLRTQRPDGSWLVRTRSFPFQPYRESGFPHGKDQWISASGTAWAAMALTLTAPPQAGQISQVF
jgi:squalene-hopene cyclase-like protein/ankyrin repeat protein